MMSFSVVPFLESAHISAPFACVKRAASVMQAISSFSIAALLSERHASLIAGDRAASLNFAKHCIPQSNGRLLQSLFAAEVC
jgi:hypothetical protein